MRLEGKVCVITGAGGGMGADAAVRFSEEGAQVAVADIDGAAAEKVAGEVGGLAVQVDVSDEASVEAMYAAATERFGGIDVLYNNAGISPADDASILDTDLDAWERVQAVNTRGVYLCCKHGIPHLLETGGGVNLEPALRAGDPLGGHIVQGHVDGVGRIRRVDDEGIEVEATQDVLRYCVEKGSIAVEGVSLTIAGLGESSFTVALIPHTREVTTLGGLAEGDDVNLEVDVLAKYVERLAAR